MEAAKENNASGKPVNNDTSVKRMDKCVAGGEAEVPRAKSTEVSETTAKVSETTTAKVAETAAEAAVTTPHSRCLMGARKIDTRKPGRARLNCSERQNGERQRGQSKLML
jgi:hypothetical protein